MLADDHWWLWSNKTRREAIRLLVVLAPKLDAESLAQLEQSVLAGPPHEMYRDDIDPESWARIMKKEVWLRLAKMDAIGTVLNTDASEKLNDLTSRNPDWRLAEDERDEFSTWISDGSKWIQHLATPRRRRELIEWLRQHPMKDGWKTDDWHDRCRDNFPTAACALYALTERGEWPVERWRDALRIWSEEAMAKRSWRYIAPVLVDASDDVLKSLAPGLGWWLGNVAKTLDRHEGKFFRFCRRILDLEAHDHPDDEMDDVATEAINHPVGHVTEALLRWWYRSFPDDGQGLPSELGHFFTDLCDVRIAPYRYGRFLLAAQVIALFRVDSDWTTRHLLTLFDWNRSRVEASSAWKGFLCWSPNLYRPLMESIKGFFLDTACYYQNIGTGGENYATLLTFAALDPGDTFTPAELRNATRQLPFEGLKETARALVRSLEGAGEQRTEHWDNRILPYLRTIWPNSSEMRTSEISESLGMLCIAAHNEFPKAVEEIRHWLLPPQYPGHLIDGILEAEYCSQFPQPALEFLNLVIGENIQWFSEKLQNCLNQIRAEESQLQYDPRFLRLQDILH